MKFPSNTTVIPNEILDAMVKGDMSDAELRASLAIYRKTWGWQKKRDRISLSQIMEIAGLSRQGALDGIERAMERGTIGREAIANGFEYFPIAVYPEDRSGDNQSTQQTDTALQGSQFSRPISVNSVDRSSSKMVNTVDTQKERDLKDKKETTTMPPTMDQPAQSGVGGGGPEANASLGKRAATRPEAPSTPVPPAPPSPPPPLGCNPPDPATNTYDYLRQQGVSKKRAAEFAHLDRGQIANWWEAEQRRDPNAPAGRLVMRLEGNPAQFQTPPPPTPADLPERPEWVNDPEEWAAMCRATPTMAANLAGSRWEGGRLVGESDYMTEFYAKRGYAERITMARALQQGRAA